MSEKISEALIVNAGDWAGVYIDGVIAYEEQTLDLFDIVRRIQNRPVRFEIDDFWASDEAYVEKYGHFPWLYSDLLASRKL